MFSFWPKSYWELIKSWSILFFNYNCNVHIGILLIFLYKIENKQKLWSENKGNWKKSIILDNKKIKINNIGKYFTDYVL